MCSSDLDFHQPDAVLPGTAAGGTNLLFGLSPVTLRRFDQVKVILAAGKVNIRVTGVLLFSALVMGLDVGDLRPLVLGEAHDGVL